MRRSADTPDRRIAGFGLISATTEQAVRDSDPVSPFSLQSAVAVLWPDTEHRLPQHTLTDIANNAAAADESGQLSPSAVDALRRLGYFGLPVPTALQGGGACLLECAAVQRRLALADPALAIAANMHLFSVGMAVEHWLRRRDSCGLILEAIATQHRIVASAFAEPGLGGALLRSTVTARRTGGGYTVTGVKSPCSLAACCDLVVFQMQSDSGEPSSLMTAFVPSTLDGIRVEQSWDALGMRGSGSDTLRFDACFIPDELIFHRCEPGAEPDEIFAAGLVWFCVTTAATYLGLVQRALDDVCLDLRRTHRPHLASTRGDLSSVQGRLGELLAPTVALEAACAGVAAQIDSRRHDPRSVMPLAIAIKHEAVDACVRAVEGLAELAGGKSYGRQTLLARLWRDVQAARFHPPARLVSRQALGRAALGLASSLDADG
jgi:alkylation response protein AidB-like acyl-CoA dehydrogenase